MKSAALGETDTEASSRPSRTYRTNIPSGWQRGRQSVNGDAMSQRAGWAVCCLWGRAPSKVGEEASCWHLSSHSGLRTGGLRKAAPPVPGKLNSLQISDERDDHPVGLGVALQGRGNTPGMHAYRPGSTGTSVFAYPSRKTPGSTKTQSRKPRLAAWWQNVVS